MEYWYRAGRFGFRNEKWFWTGQCCADCFWVCSTPSPGDVATCFADNTRAVTELGWQPKYQLEDMLKHSWNWQSKTPKVIVKYEGGATSAVFFDHIGLYIVILWYNFPPVQSILSLLPYEHLTPKQILFCLWRLSTFFSMYLASSWNFLLDGFSSIRLAKCIDVLFV